MCKFEAPTSQSSCGKSIACANCATHSSINLANSATLVRQMVSGGKLFHCTGMSRGLSLTQRSKMTCVRTNEWWVAKAWTVGTLTIWASFLRLFAQLAAHEFWKWCCEFSFSATFSMGEISKKMRDGWANAAGDYMASTSSSNNAQHTLTRWIEFSLQCSKALNCYNR